jgi:hypothetical protein
VATGGVTHGGEAGIEQLIAGPQGLLRVGGHEAPANTQRERRIGAVRSDLEEEHGVRRGALA